MTDKFVHSASLPPAIPTSLLPPASSADLLLVSAEPLEDVQTWHLNAGEWRGPLDMEQYLDREEELKKLALTKDGQATTWILTSNALPRNADGTRPILCSCESLRKQGYVAKGGKVEKVVAHGVASVYTRPEHRNKGYAGRMMTELGKALETWQQPAGVNGSFSALFSDIGTQYYSRFGWKAFPSTHIILKPLGSEDLYELTRSCLSLPAVSDLNASDLSALPTIEHVEAELAARSATDPKAVYVAFRPDLEHYGWHHGREEVQCRILDLPEPQLKGAIHKDTGIALIWSRVYASKPEEYQLAVLRTVIPPKALSSNSDEAEKATAALLLRAQLEAYRWKMQAGVEVWSPEDVVLRAAQSLRKEEEGQVEVVARDKVHVCCLKWANEDDNVLWVANERFEWC